MQTEIVVAVEITGEPPPKFVVVMSRSTLFNTVPTGLPPNVVGYLALNGTSLNLDVKPAGATTRLAFQPSKDVKEARDLEISVVAPGYEVTPAQPQKLEFQDGVSQEILFKLSQIPPDMAAPVDAKKPDGGAAGDMAKPLDAAPNRG